MNVIGNIGQIFGGEGLSFEEIHKAYSESEIGRKYLWLCENTDLKNYHLNPDEVKGPKINGFFVHNNMHTECYREVLVSYLPMIQLLKEQVVFEEADYVLYMHAYARVEDLGEKVLEEIRWISKNRKPGAEIIVLGKAANVEKDIKDGEIDNITFVYSHFCEYLGKRFGFDIKEEYFVYDDLCKHLAIWPVDGCQNKCRFCRRSYMHIPFESQRFTFLKEKLDWYKENEPEKLKKVSLRAENLTEYGIDLYGKPMLHRIISLLDSYDEIEEIEIPIGLCIGEMTDDIVDALCNSKKFKSIALNLEAASNRLLKLCGKHHTMERAQEICDKLRIANPEIKINSTIMIGIPTETVGEIIGFSKYIVELGIDYLHCNFYEHSNRDGFKGVEKLSERCKYYHLELLIQNLIACRADWYCYRIEHPILSIRCRDFWGRKKATRKYLKYIQLLKKSNEVYQMDFPSKDFVRHYIMYYNSQSKREVLAAKILRKYAEENNMIRFSYKKLEEILITESERLSILPL